MSCRDISATHPKHFEWKVGRLLPLRYGSLGVVPLTTALPSGVTHRSWFPPFRHPSASRFTATHQDWTTVQMKFAWTHYVDLHK